MSLLMDALRKAEADKKQASAATIDAEAAPRNLPQDDDIDLAETIASPVKSAAAAASVQATIKSAVRPARDDILALEPLEPDPKRANDDTSSSDRLSTSSSTPDPRSILSTPRGVETRLENYVDDSKLVQTPESDPLARLTAAPVVSSGITETVVSAHTVFEAGTPGPSRRVIVWGSVIAVAIGCVFAGAGVYYFQQAPTAHQIPSPSVAAKVEKSPPKALPIVVVESVPVSPAASVDSASDLEVAGLPPTATEIDQTPTDFSATPSAEIDFPDYTLPALDADGHEAKTGIGVTEHGVVPDATRNLQNASAAQVAVGVRPGEVRIARSTHALDTDDILRRAYAAYVSGDFTTSEELYQEVLRHRPEQRDALLGVAALKLRAGDIADAHRLYREVLKRDPKNPTANAAIFSLESNEGDRVTESRLRSLLDEGVDSGYIYFSLGNLYARHRRWGDAQQAYFEALRNSPTNPDYNYNLAVSLDRIGQRQAAVKYYDAAVAYTDAQPAGFDPALALARIQSIGRDSTP